MSPRAIQSLIEMFGVEHGVQILNLFTAPQKDEVAFRRRCFLATGFSSGGARLQSQWGGGRADELPTPEPTSARVAQHARVVSFLETILLYFPVFVFPCRVFLCFSFSFYFHFCVLFFSFPLVFLLSVSFPFCSSSLLCYFC